MKLPSFGAFGKFAHVMIAVPGASEGVAHPLLRGVDALTGASLGCVHFTMTLKIIHLIVISDNIRIDLSQY